MIGVDTNVLVRLVVDDDKRQSGAAKGFFASRSPDDPAFVSLVVVAELVWLLRETLKVPYEAIVGVLERMLGSADFVFERSDFVADAVNLAKETKIDISDYLIARVGLEHGCRSVVTFDILASKRIPGMELLR